MPVARLQNEEGFQLVEILIAMTILAIGISAIVAGFSSGMIAVVNAGRASTAAALADKQMEAYRADLFNTLKTQLTCGAGAQASAVCAQPSTPVGADNRTYSVLTSITWSCATDPTGTAG